LYAKLRRRYSSFLSERAMHALLFSNSRNPDGGYLTHTLPVLKAHIKPKAKIAFLPFAGTSWDDYLKQVGAALAPLKASITSAADAKDAIALIAECDVVMIGGGNTFRLLAETRARGLLAPIAERVRAGNALFVGWSAGSNMACPTIRTTNDMPIVDPNGFDALGFVPYQINPHYTNAQPTGHQGETRDQRIAEFLSVNPNVTVIGLPEGDWIEVRGKVSTLHGPFDAKRFRAKGEVTSIARGAVI
jgi:dipeptidase E